MQINDFINNARDQAVQAARNLTYGVLQANKGLFGNVVGAYNNTNNDITRVNQAIMQKGVNGLNPEEKQLFQNYYMNPVMGVTNAPEASIPQVNQAKSLFNALNKNSQEVINPIRNTEDLIKLAKQVGVDTMTGKVPRTTEEIVNDIVKAKNPNALITQNMRIGDIPKIDLPSSENPVRFIKDNKGLFAGSKSVEGGLGDLKKINLGR